jgi:aminoglycoside phosphotransferase (APT) family kinase protein
MIPKEKKALVERALQKTFGASEFDDIYRITKGLSSDLVFRIVVKGYPFLLRIMTRMDEMNDPARIFACMKAAAEAGVAPRVLYFSTEDGIAIIDFIEEAPFTKRQALALLPATIRRLHKLPRFPKAFNYVTAHKGFIWRFRTAGLVREEEIAEVYRRYEEICAVYPHLDEDLVSCHMDLKPENILFDGHRVWLVDWMAASVNDRYFDLAIVANFLIASEEDELTYLGQYFGESPDEFQQARFFLMSQVLHMFAATIFLLLGVAGKPITTNEDLPSFREFHRLIWAGEIDLADNNLKIVYGKVHWEQLLKNIRRARFDESVATVGERNERRGHTQRLLPSAP